MKFPIIIILFFYSCSTIKKLHPSNFKIQYSVNFPMKINDSIIWSPFDAFITVHDKYKIYEFPYHKTYEIDSRLIYDSLKYEYFLFDSSKSHGYIFKEINDPIGQELKKDSVLISRGVVSAEASTINEIFKITNNAEVKNKNEVIHKYYINDTLVDSVYYYYNSELNNITHHSLSKILDATYLSKLYKIEVFYKKSLFPIDSRSTKFFGLLMEIKKVPLPNLGEMELLINKIENAENKKAISKKPPE